MKARGFVLATFVLLAIPLGAIPAMAEDCEKAGVGSEAVYKGLAEGRSLEQVMVVLRAFYPGWPQSHLVELATIGQLAKSQKEAAEKGAAWCRKRGW